MGEPVARVSIVGLHGGECFGAAAAAAVAGAEVVFGAARHLGRLAPAGARVELGPDLGATLDDAFGRAAAGAAVCVLASGDPGFFGITRMAAERAGTTPFEVFPAPSSVAVAFGRIGAHWDDAVVVSAHGRPPEPAVEAVVRHPKVAVLCSPDSPPERIAALAVAAGCGHREATVASRLGEDDEEVWTGPMDDLASRRFDPLSVLVARAPAVGGAGAVWGQPAGDYRHRAGMITKPEVRAVAIAKLRLPAAGVLWDVGAGSGSVAAECAALAPGLAVYAIERAERDLPALRANLAGGRTRVVAGEAPAALGALPDPDRVFVGGGGLDVLEHCLGRLRPGGTVVATYASLERGATAAHRLGQMVQVAVSRAARLGDPPTLRLAAENPVFVCWGPA